MIALTGVITVGSFAIVQLMHQTPAPHPAPADNSISLNNPTKKDIAMQLVSSAENSNLDWKAQYAYIEDIGDGRGYTGGLIGFTSGTGDMLALVQYYTSLSPANPLAKYLPALQAINGSDSHKGLDPGFVADWKRAAQDAQFRSAQDYERDLIYFTPAVKQGQADGVHTLGQFIYYDALVVHGPGDDENGFGAIRNSALAHAKSPYQGGDETRYLTAFLDARDIVMKKEKAHEDTSRIDTEQRIFLEAGNLNLNPPLRWQTYGDSYKIGQ